MNPTPSSHGTRFATIGVFTFALLSACTAALVPAAKERTPEPVAPHTSDPAFTPFLTADRCAVCHSHSPKATALTTRTGDDASPHGTWQATAMANAFRDPYWRAQMAREVEIAPANKVAIESMCLNCHAPAASHTARLTGTAALSIESALPDALAVDGVSCTVCHRTTAEGLGTPASFQGHLAITGDARIYGPFADPTPGPMKAHTGFTPTHGEHVRTSALCGACHTLYTKPGPDAAPFLEQALYLEWRNSSFNDEAGATSETRTCQQCHMPDVGPMRIARNPRGSEFNIAVRDGVRTHTFVGGNAFLSDLLRVNAAELGVTATAAALQRIADASRALLAHSTAKLTVINGKRAGDRVEFDVHIENLTGHKLPSGYPSRRMWINLEVRAGREVLFSSGDSDAGGALVGIANELALPHVDRIDRAGQVAVYEMLANDLEGHPTTSLTRMASRSKDNRILPRGWKKNGPNADETKPVGTDGDDDFVAGSDTVTYSVALPASAGDLLIVAQLQYQAIPPAWTASLASSTTPEAQKFLAMYAKADRSPEVIATATLSVPK